MITQKQLANLRPKKLTSEEAKRMGSNGGKKSVEKRRELKTWKQILTTMLQTPTNDKNAEVLAKYGIDKDDATLQAFILHQHILNKAMSGDKWAIEKLAQITDNLGTQKIEVSATTSQVAEDIGAFIDADRKTKKHN